jgi:F-type H+-transporting ATPase subunit gamma
MASFRDIGAGTLRNTRQITRAMQMLSAAKLPQAMERALAARPYALALTQVISRIQGYDPETGELRHPLLARREEKTALLIVVSGEKGAARNFNSKILAVAAPFIQSMQGRNFDIIAVGGEGCRFFRARYPVGEPGEARKGPIQVVGEYPGLLKPTSFSIAREISQKVGLLYMEGNVDSVYTLYNEFKSSIAWKLVVDKVLPIRAISEQPHEMTEEATNNFATVPSDHIYESPPAFLLHSLVLRYISVQLFRPMIESEAAEHAAGIAANDSTTTNASDMIDALVLPTSGTTQAEVKDIIEIVSG